MEIVLEYVLLDNFLIDALLLALTLKTLRQPLSRWGIILSSSFGAGFAVVSPLICVTGILAILLKFLVAFIMSFIVCFSFRRILPRFLLFTLYTFAFGGGLIAIFTFMGIQVYDAMYIGYVSSLPLGTILVSTLAFGAICFRLIRYLSHRKAWENSIQLGIEILGKMKTIRGFVDTGNTLKNREGKPIVVLPERELRHWFDTHARMALLIGKTNGLGLKNVDSITVNSLGGNYKMLVFDAEIIIDGAKVPACVGIANGSVKLGDCNAIVGNDLLEAVKC